MLKSFLLLSFIILSVAGTVLPDAACAQLPRERADRDEPITNIFWANTNVGLNTVRSDPAGTMNTTVKHAFGLVEGGVETFFGMDDGANTRLGVEYALTDRFMAGIGRMTFRNVVDLSMKYNLLRQTTTGSTPIDLAVYGSAGAETLSGTGLNFSERLSYFASVMAARNFGRFSFQVSPMYGHFNRATGENRHHLFGLGVSAQYELNDRLALGAEYLPVLGERNPGTNDALGISLNIDTGGHIFQLFFTTTQWHNEQYIMARNSDRFWEGAFRFGFNIHRVFVLREDR